MAAGMASLLVCVHTVSSEFCIRHPTIHRESHLCEVQDIRELLI